MIAGIQTRANPSPDATAAIEPAPARIARWVAEHPDFAAELAAITCADRLRAALLDFAARQDIELDAATRDALIGSRPARFAVSLAAWPLAQRHGWQPIALEWGSSGAELVWACGSAAADLPFHEQGAAALRALPLNRLLAVTTPLTEAFVAMLEADALPVQGLVFHMSRCGSTLVAQALKAWRGLRVVSEPALLDTAFLLARAGHDPQWLLARMVVAALAQPSGADTAVVFKLDAWHALALADIVARLGAPWLFVYRNPIEVLASHRREPGRHTVPGMLPEAWLPAAPESEGPTLEQHAARVLGALCAAVVPHAEQVNLLNYDELPQAIVARVASHFELDPGKLDRAQFEASCACHAKRPYEAFAGDGVAKRALADSAMYESAGRWIETHYRALEQIRTIVRSRRVALTCDLEALRADLAAVAPAGWHPHFNTQYYSGDWSGIALRAQPHGRSPLYADPVGGGFADTAAMRSCRYVPALLAQLECEIESVRFLRLGPGAEIREHRDPGLRFEDGVARFHVPVYTNPDVEFMLGGETLRLAEGECWYLNFDQPHRVANRSAEDRVHLVIDVRVNAWIESLLRAGS